MVKRLDEWRVGVSRLPFQLIVRLDALEAMIVTSEKLALYMLVTTTLLCILYMFDEVSLHPIAWSACATCYMLGFSRGVRHELVRKLTRG